MLQPWGGSCVRRFLRQSKGDIDAARWRLGVLASACGDDDKLAAVHFVGGGSGVAGEGEICFPKKLAGGFIEGAEFFVEVGCSNKHQAACSDDRTTIIFRTSALLSLRRKFRKFT